MPFMKKLPKLGLTFWYGEKLSNIKKKPEGLFPLYIAIRLSKNSTKIKSITASYWFERQAKAGLSEADKFKYIERNIRSFIQRDTIYINNLRDLHIKAYGKDFENWEFLQNIRVRDTLNISATVAFDNLVHTDFRSILMKFNMEKVAEVLLHLAGPFPLYFCMEEINKEVFLELKRNETIASLFEIYSKIKNENTSFIEFLYIDIPAESTILKAVQRNFWEETIKYLKGLNQR